jgi:hypothetical protein
MGRRSDFSATSVNLSDNKRLRIPWRDISPGGGFTDWVSVVIRRPEGA